jgi:hypothetical protein
MVRQALKSSRSPPSLHMWNYFAPMQSWESSSFRTFSEISASGLVDARLDKAAPSRLDELGFVGTEAKMLASSITSEKHHILSIQWRPKRSLCVVYSKVFKLPRYQWSVSTAAFLAKKINPMYAKLFLLRIPKIQHLKLGIFWCKHLGLAGAVWIMPNW